MTTDERPTTQYQFTSGIELPAALTALGIEYLDVSPTRAFVIYARSILDIDVVEGCLTEARTVEIDVIGQPSDAPEDPSTLVETVIDRLKSAVVAADRRPPDVSGANAS